MSVPEPKVRDQRDPRRIQDRYREIRAFTRWLCEPLQPEDCVIQSMPDASPIRWHLAHTTWFFETFVLQPLVPGYDTFRPEFNYLFNSYYNSVGQQFPRAMRGLISRPTVAEIWQYRDHVDRHLERELARMDDSQPLADWVSVVELGLQHEQQHQELMLTDLKHLFSCNPLWPEYRPPVTRAADGCGEASGALSMTTHPRQIVDIGVDRHQQQFAFDNESPRHEQLVPAYRLGDRLVTNDEYLEFMQDGGYETPTLWLSLGWHTVQQERWCAPLYWVERDGEWFEFTLHGLRPLDGRSPVCHVSLFEADAFARWRGQRLPTEFEWEQAAAHVPIAGHFVESLDLHPRSVGSAAGQPSAQLFGDVWEWTNSAYLPYPGYRADAGALGEYNGKFMCNQFVLRGGSCATSESHIRTTYRNFFPPEARWQFTGIRLADAAN